MSSETSQDLRAAKELLRFESESDKDARAMLGLVAAISTVVVGHAPLSDQVRETTNYVRQVFNADACVVRELVGRRLLLVAHEGIPEGVLPHSMPAALGIARRLLRRKKPLAVSDVPRDPTTATLHKRTKDTEFRFNSYAGSPMLFRGKPVGIIGIYSVVHNRRFTPLELNYLNIVANQLAVSVLNHRLYVELSQRRDLLESEVRQRGRAEIRLQRQLEKTQELAATNAQLVRELKKSYREISRACDAALEGWSAALDLRDEPTHGHTMRVTQITERLARRLNVPEEDMIHIRRGALLHDIGKISIPDSILKKPGPLLPEEREHMKKHTDFAHGFLAKSEFLRPAIDIPYCHHERWDGTGYPRGLKGNAIPLPARIFAVVDVWDALSSDRPYREAWPRNKVLAYLQGEAGRLFDPAITREFIEMMSDGTEAGGDASRSAAAAVRKPGFRPKAGLRSD